MIERNLFAVLLVAILLSFSYVSSSSVSGWFDKFIDKPKAISGEKEKKISLKKKIYSLFIISLILVAIPFSSAGFFDNFYAKITGHDTATTSLNITLGSTAPQIHTVYNVTVKTPSEGTFVDVSVFFVANDTDGADDLANATANFTVNRSGEASRTSGACVPLNGSGNSVTYNCSLKMWYFDGPGIWTVNVSVQDTSGNLAVNNSTAFVYDTLTAMTMSPAALTWSTITLNSVNATANNDPIIVNNTGNDINDINVIAIDLLGETPATTDYLRATNFSVAINATGLGGANDNTGCMGNLQSNNTGVNITSGFLYRGNNTLLNNGTSSGQQQLLFCLRYVNSSLSAQSYSTLTGGAWTVSTV